MSSSFAQRGRTRQAESIGQEVATRAGLPCLEVMRQVSLFAGLNDRQLSLVSPPCQRKPVCKGHVLFFEGDLAQEIFIILAGQVCLEVELAMGPHHPSRTIEVEEVGPNGVLGLCGLVEPRRMLLTARCLGDVDTVTINIDQLRTLMKAQPDVGLIVLENAFKSTRERLMRAHQRLIAEVGLAVMYQANRNY